MRADRRFVLESAAIAATLAVPTAIGFAVASDGDVIDWPLTWAGLALAAVTVAAFSAARVARRDDTTRSGGRPFGMALRVVGIAYLLFLGVAVVLVTLDQAFRGAPLAGDVFLSAPPLGNVAFVMAYVALISIGVGLVPALLLHYVACRRHLRRAGDTAAGRA